MSNGIKVPREAALEMIPIAADLDRSYSSKLCSVLLGAIVYNDYDRTVEINPWTDDQDGILQAAESCLDEVDMDDPRHEMFEELINEYERQI